MFRLLLFLALASLTTVATNYNEQPIDYQSIYGQTTNEKLPRSQVLPIFGRELLRFLREGDQLRANELHDVTPKFNQEYDFVVVGAGSAGAVVASRLSEMKNATVLLIEAGDSENLLMDVPLLVSYLQYSDKINWKYRTEPSNTHCLGMKGRSCKWPRGKVMGGSSVLNFMISSRGTRRDYDEWAEMGNEGWSYDEVLKYFKKLEGMQIPELRDSEFHGSNGPINIEYPPFHTPLASAFLEAGLQMGYPVVDYNGPREVGFSYIQATMKNGTRMSTNRAYLHPVRNRRNLFVTRLSHVNKVLIDPRTKRAHGVHFTKRNMDIQVRARKEIILCAGAIGSAQILMLSGVGPKDHLTEMKIEVVQDAPVGENLMDHVHYEGLVFSVDQPVGIMFSDITNPINSYIKDFTEKKSGPITIPGACEALAFIDIDNPKSLTSWPNVEFLFLSSSMASEMSFRHSSAISDEYWIKYFSGQSRDYSWTVLPILLRPKSRGKILLRSRNPNVHPRIFANYFDDDDDVRVMVKGIRKVIEISRMDSMQRFNSRMTDLPVPGCENYVQESDGYWECALRTFSTGLYHPSGTCKMAAEEDETGVVDPRLKVKGVKGLRVADASIMPNIVTGHTNLPVIMIAEKLADMVKEEWGFIDDNSSNLTYV